MSNSPTQSERYAAVPLFPLPNVVLFPRAVQPLHIFEERYKAMTADALDGDGRLAMALLRPGWEKEYYSRPGVDPVVCVGRILSHERLPDGRYNFLLQGEARARIVRERRDGPWGDKPYRVAELRVIEEVPALESDLAAARRRLLRLFDGTTWGRTAAGRQFRDLLRGTAPTAALADLLASTYLDDILLKQSLLSEPDVRCRIERLADALETYRPTSEPATLHAGDPTLN